MATSSMVTRGLKMEALSRHEVFDRVSVTYPSCSDHQKAEAWLTGQNNADDESTGFTFTKLRTTIALRSTLHLLTSCLGMLSSYL